MDVLAADGLQAAARVAGGRADDCERLSWWNKKVAVRFFRYMSTSCSTIYIIKISIHRLPQTHVACCLVYMCWREWSQLFCFITIYIYTCVYVFIIYIFYNIYIYKYVIYISSTPWTLNLRQGFTFMSMAWNVSCGLAVIWHGMVAASSSGGNKNVILPCFTHMPHTVKLVESKICSL